LTKIIVIDPGHGGNDPGASAFNLQEKDLNLDIALQLKTLLANYAEVRLTRNSDVFVGLSQRAAFANSLKADLFVSIHINAGGGTGFESYLRKGADQENIGLAKTLHSSLADFYKGKGFPDRGIKYANFAVLRETSIPAILFENLFIDQEKDVEKLKDASFRREIAQAMARGIIEGLNLEALQQVPNVEVPTATPTPTTQPSENWAEPAFQRLINLGLVKNQHSLTSPVTWGELSAVITRLLDRLKI